MKSNNKQEFIIGVLCGCIFALVAWGYDGYVLWKVNAAYPWLKLALGILPSALLGGLAGVITMKINNLFLRMLLWIGVGILFSLLSSYIPFKAVPRVVRLLNPDVGELIVYDALRAISARRFITMIMTIIFLFIAGLIFENANESIRYARGVVGMVFSAIFLLAFFAGAGYSADSNFNYDLRLPLIALDEKLDYVATVDPTTLDEFELRRLNRYTKLGVDLAGPHTLTLLTFDQYFSQVNILVDFDGTLTTCSVISGYASTCKLLE